MGYTDKNRGFTLIEIAIGLIVIGLLTLPLIELYKIQLASEKETYNEGLFTRVRNKINEFVIDNGRYPIPASLLVGPDDALYGAEATAFMPCPSWPTPTGVCRTVAGSSVLIGAVPTEALGMHPQEGLDYWGNKVLYAVDQGKTAAYSPTVLGDVNVQGFGEVGAGLLAADQFDFILLSHGESGGGAYAEYGAQVQPCPGVAAGLDGENCDFDADFIMRENNATANDLGGGIATNLIAGVNFYDDYTLEQNAIPLDLWYQSLDDSIFALTTSARIGIGTEDPLAKVHVVGDLNADAILTDAICRNGGECFDPNLIAGISADMNCDLNTLAGNEPILWLANSQVYCATPVDSAGNILDNGMPDGGLEFAFPENTTPGTGFGRIDCADTAQLMVGIDANGDPVCATP